MPTLSNPALESTPTLEGEGSSVARATELITSDNSRTGMALANPNSVRPSLTVPECARLRFYGAWPWGEGGGEGLGAGGCNTLVHHMSRLEVISVSPSVAMQ